MIIIGQYGDDYASRLADDCRSIINEEIYPFYFCVKNHKGGEYTVRLVDKHCGDPNSCTNECPNPKELARLIGEGEDVALVIRGKYGKDWNSDKLIGTARQAIEILKGGDREYLGGAKAERLCLVLPHEAYSKQDKLFTKDDTENGRLEGAPKTIKLIRKTLQNDGVSLLLTIMPHDYRREGWIRKKAYIGQEQTVYTDWKKLDPSGLIYLEDWKNFAWAIDPTADEIASYIRTAGLNIDTLIGPDLNTNRMCSVLNQRLGIWTDQIDSRRSKEDSSIVEAGDLGLLGKEHVEGKVVGLADDLVLTGSKSKAAIESLKKYNPAEIHIIACHGECIGDIHEYYESQGIDMHFTDTVDSPNAKISTTRAVAERIKQHFLD